MKHNSIHRNEIAQAVVDDYLFEDHQTGKRDCVYLAASVLDAFGIDHPLKRARPFRTPAGAERSLRKLGFGDLAEAIDSIGLERIGPASALPCDLIAIQADGAQPGGWCLGVVVGPNKIMAFIELNGRIFADTGNLTEMCVHAATAGLTVIGWRVA